MKQTIVEKIEPQPDGHVGIRLGLLDTGDGKVLRKVHRLVVEPGGDVEVRIAAVNADITTRPDLMAQPIDGIEEIKAACRQAHTRDKVKRYRERISADIPQ